MKEKIINIPNAITLVRLLLIIPFLYLLFTGNRLSALIVFLLAVLSDKLDGTIARKLKQETQFGKTFDALTDSFLVISALISLDMLKIITIFLGIAIIAPRLITGLVFILFFATKRIKFFTTIYSRVAAIFVYIAISCILLNIGILIYGLIIGIYVLSIIHWYEMYKIKKTPDS